MAAAATDPLDVSSDEQEEWPVQDNIDSCCNKCKIHECDATFQLMLQSMARTLKRCFWTSGSAGWTGGAVGSTAISGKLAVSTFAVWTLFFWMSFHASVQKNIDRSRSSASCTGDWTLVFVRQFVIFFEHFKARSTTWTSLWVRGSHHGKEARTQTGGGTRRTGVRKCKAGWWSNKCILWGQGRLCRGRSKRRKRKGRKKTRAGNALSGWPARLHSGKAKSSKRTSIYIDACTIFEQSLEIILLKPLRLNN